MKAKWKLKTNKIFKTKAQAQASASRFNSFGWKTQVRNIEHLLGIHPFKYGVYMSGEKIKKRTETK